MSENLINTKQLMEWLSINKNTANNWRRKGMPYKQFGKKIMYDKGEIVEWVKTHHTRKEIPSDTADIIKYFKGIAESTSKNEFLELANRYGKDRHTDMVNRLTEEEYQSLIYAGLIGTHQDLRSKQMAKACDYLKDKIIDNPQNIDCKLLIRFLGKLSDILSKNTGNVLDEQPTDADIQELLQISKF